MVTDPFLLARLTREDQVALEVFKVLVSQACHPDLPAVLPTELATQAYTLADALLALRDRRHRESEAWAAEKAAEAVKVAVPAPAPAPAASAPSPADEPPAQQPLALTAGPDDQLEYVDPELLFHSSGGGRRSL